MADATLSGLELDKAHADDQKRKVLDSVAHASAQTIIDNLRGLAKMDERIEGSSKLLSINLLEVAQAFTLAAGWYARPFASISCNPEEKKTSVDIPNPDKAEKCLAVVSAALELARVAALLGDRSIARQDDPTSDRSE
jgi:hypothetical protein